ncbi:SGNH/GDSL hydrolase family protein [Bacillus atrophaeus]|uniref:SGNH/GDSL hydrolase family protein n=1 Tax=Bacillus atrophaeus TaxID=1452 RepID=UPI002280D69D|nr:SGNH/GDSL hydrolase family protein [Bacillus atrophaeus]MCY8856120.1 SGNH/GDSL hydrolase family protein [Bacillus atrophaeus]
MKQICILFLLVLVTAGCEGRGYEDVVAFGDSNTRGSNWNYRDYPKAQQWVDILKTAERGNLDILNAGIGGQTTEDARLRFESDVLDQKPEYVFIMFGTNDAAILAQGKPRVSKTRFKENLTYFIEESKKHKINPILMTCIPIIEGNGKHHLFYYSRYKSSMFQSKGGARKWHNSYNDITREVAENLNVPLVDNWKNFIKAEGGNETDEALIQSGLIDPSGNHMTPKGARIIFEGIKDGRVLQQ